jgi:Flp pilus assembly protein TadG
MRLAGEQRGNALVEFAMGFSILFACISGVFQYGYSMYIYNSLQAAVTGASMYAARATYDTRNSSFDTAVKNMAVYGNTGGLGAVLVPGLSTSKITVLRSPASGVPTAITVKVDTLTVNALFRQFTFTGKPSVTVAFSGEYFTSP